MLTYIFAQIGALLWCCGILAFGWTAGAAPRGLNFFKKIDRTFLVRAYGPHPIAVVIGTMLVMVTCNHLGHASMAIAISIALVASTALMPIIKAMVIRLTDNLAVKHLVVLK